MDGAHLPHVCAPAAQRSPRGRFGRAECRAPAYRLKEMPKPAELQKISQPWHPYCTVASWYLWRSLDGSANLD